MGFLVFQALCANKYYHVCFSFSILPSPTISIIINSHNIQKFIDFSTTQSPGVKKCRFKVL